MTLLINLLLFVPAALLAMIAYSASSAPDAAGVLRVASTKLLRVLFWTVVIVVIMQAIQWVLLP